MGLPDFQRGQPRYELKGIFQDAGVVAPGTFNTIVDISVPGRIISSTIRINHGVAGVLYLDDIITPTIDGIGSQAITLRELLYKPKHIHDLILEVNYFDGIDVMWLNVISGVGWNTNFTLVYGMNALSLGSIAWGVQIRYGGF